jgi:MFS family permease
MKEEGIQLLSNLSIFATMIFIPLIAASFDASPFEIALIVMVYNLAIFMSNYACGRGADIYGRRTFLLGGLLASAGAFALHLLAYDPFSLALIRILAGVCVGMWGPALLAYVFEAKKSLGRVMGFGGLGWGTGVFLAGLLAMYWRIYFMSSICFFFAFLLALTIPKMKERKLKIPLFPKEVIRKNIPAYLAVVVRHTGASAVWVLLPVYLNQELLFAESVIGYVYAANAFTQFVVMMFVDKLPSKVSIPIGLVTTILCFIFFERATMIWQWAMLLMFIGVAWAFLYVGATVYVMERNVERATSTGLLMGSMSLAGIAGPIFGGLIAAMMPFRYNFYFAIALTFIGIVLYYVTHYSLSKHPRNIPEKGIKGIKED